MGTRERLQEFLENFFEHLTRKVCNRPKLFVLSSIGFCLLCCSGFYVLEERTDIGLWVPYEAESVRAYDLYRNAFPEEPATFALFTKAENVLQKDNLIATLKLFQKTAGLVDDSSTSLDAVCLHDPSSGLCIKKSIFAFWGYNPSVLEADNNHLMTINVSLAAHLDLEQSISKLRRNAAGIVTGAEALANQFMMNSSVETPIRSRWDDGAAKFIIEEKDQLPQGLWALGMGTTSFNTELGRAMNSNLPRIGLAYFFILGYLILNLGRRWDKVYNRCIVAFFAVLSVGLAVGGSIGFMAFFGVPYTMLTPIVAFLVAGLAADDSFIIADSVDRADSKLAPADRLAEAARHAGPSISVTSFTDIAAFSAGAFSQLPAIRYFCITIAFCVFLIYLLQLFYFIPWMALDVKRVEEGRHSLLWWRQAAQPIGRWAEKKKRVRVLHLYFSKVHNKLLAKFSLRVGILVVSLVILFCAAKLATQLGEGLEPDELLSRDSYIHEYFAFEKHHFAYSVTLSVFTVLPTGTDFSIPIHLRRFATFIEQLIENANTTLLMSTSRNWLGGDVYSADFPAFAKVHCAPGIGPGDISPAGAAFEPCLKSWYDLGAVQSLYNRDLHFNSSVLKGGSFEHNINPYSTLDGFQVLLNAEPALSSPAKVKLLDAVYSSVRKYSEEAGLSYECLPYNYAFRTHEQFRIAVKEAWLNMAIAAVAVGVLTLVLLYNASMAFLVMLNVVMIDVEILGAMRLLGITINSVSSVVLVISIGLTVDYLLHIAVGYMFSRRGDRLRKMQHSMKTVGVSVANGVITTFLGVSTMMLTDSNIFWIFFKLFVVMIVAACYHGFFVLPAMVTFWGHLTKEENSLDMQKYLERHGVSETVFPQWRQKKMSATELAETPRL